ncbi:hypothetical protein Nepgr_033801 [Nepenthes gracilis]|uniref:Uncharacterized protein n=1 Tax=Nepenthes gracilis TaxID=150966 RepID=A0AAD3TM34_NEPGR|nr:hypothetical protein Nepgr_033801 [Nepenthes gracilis]
MVFVLGGGLFGAGGDLITHDAASDRGRNGAIRVFVLEGGDVGFLAPSYSFDAELDDLDVDVCYPGSFW